jgi:hypothetical protein
MYKFTVTVGDREVLVTLSRRREWQEAMRLFGLWDGQLADPNESVVDPDHGEVALTRKIQVTEPGRSYTVSAPSREDLLAMLRKMNGGPPTSNGSHKSEKAEDGTEPTVGQRIWAVLSETEFKTVNQVAEELPGVNYKSLKGTFFSKTGKLYSLLERKKLPDGGLAFGRKKGVDDPWSRTKGPSMIEQISELLREHPEGLTTTVIRQQLGLSAKKKPSGNYYDTAVSQAIYDMRLSGHLISNYGIHKLASGQGGAT